MHSAILSGSLSLDGSCRGTSADRAAAPHVARRPGASPQKVVWRPPGPEIGIPCPLCHVRLVPAARARLTLHVCWAPAGTPCGSRSGCMVFRRAQRMFAGERGSPALANEHLSPPVEVPTASPQEGMSPGNAAGSHRPGLHQPLGRNAVLHPRPGCRACSAACLPRPPHRPGAASRSHEPPPEEGGFKAPREPPPENPSLNLAPPCPHSS